MNRLLIFLALLASSAISAEGTDSDFFKCFNDPSVCESNAESVANGASESNQLSCDGVKFNLRKQTSTTFWEFRRDGHNYHKLTVDSFPPIPQVLLYTNLSGKNFVYAQIHGVEKSAGQLEKVLFTIDVPGHLSCNFLFKPNAIAQKVTQVPTANLGYVKNTFQQSPNAEKRPQSSPANKVMVADKGLTDRGDMLRRSFTGFNSDARKAIQTALTNFGFYDSLVDGLYGPGTRNALSSYMSSKAINTSSEEAVKGVLLELIKRGTSFDQTAPSTKTLVMHTNTEEFSPVDFIGDLEDFVASNPSELDPIQLAKLYIPAKAETKSDTGPGTKFKSLADFALSSERFRTFHEDRQNERIKAIEIQLDENFAFIVSSIDLLKLEIAKDPLSEKAMKITGLVGQYGDINRERDSEMLPELASALGIELNNLGLTESSLVAESTSTTNADFAELLNLNVKDALLIVHHGRDAPQSYINLDGSFSFYADKAVVCAPSLMNSDPRYQSFIGEKLAAEFPNISMNFDRHCADGLKGTDILLIDGKTIADGVGLPSLALLEHYYKNKTLTNHRYFAFEEFDEQLNQLELQSQNLTAQILEGSRLGFGAVYSVQNEYNLCMLDVDTELLGFDQAIQRLESIMQLTEGRALRNQRVTTNINAAFRELQKGQCGVIFAKANSLSSLLAAASTSEFDLKVLPVWISNSAIESRKTEILEARSEKNKSAQQRREELAARQLEEQKKSENLQNELAVRQATSRSIYDKRVKNLAAQLDRTLDEIAKSVEKAYIRREGFEQPVRTFSFYADIPQWLSDQLSKGWSLERVSSEVSDYGTATWRGREIEAFIAKVQFYTKNADLGRYSEDCWVVAYKIDEEFERIRDSHVTRCQSYDSTYDWASAAAFESRWNFTAQ